MAGQHSEQWYLVYCKPRQETTARRNLERQGYLTYLPRIRQTRHRAGRRVSIIAPMFPRYLFIRLSTETHNWGPIRSTLGVVSIVKFGQAAAAVPDRLVEALRQGDDMEGIQVLPPEQYGPGTRVRIVEGGFAGYEGIFLARSGRDRVTVLLNVLGRETPTQVSPGAISPAD